MNLVVRRTIAAGDLVQALPIATALMKLGHQVRVKTAPELHFLVTRHRCNPVLDINENVGHVNLDGAYETHPYRKHLSFAAMYIEVANQQLHKYSIRIEPQSVCIPKLCREWSPMVWGFLRQFKRPWVMIVPRSNTPVTRLLPFAEPDITIHHSPNRTIPDVTWSEACSNIKATCFWLGIHTAAPPYTIPLELYSLHDVARMIDYADALATVDTGPMHIAYALGVKTVVIKQSTDPRKTCGTFPCLTVIQSELDCLACTYPVCPLNAANPPCQEINPRLISDAVNEAIA